MDTKKAEAFLTTVELGSMNKAAEKLNYTQTGLLYMIKTLEQELGTQLFIRTTQGVLPTKAGMKLRPIMEEFIASKDKLMDCAQELSIAQSHTIYIAAYPAFTRFQIPAVINQFLTDFPDINIDIRIGPEKSLLEWVSNGVVDLAIGEPPDKAEFAWMHLIDEEIYVAIPKKIDHSDKRLLPLEDLLNYTIAFSGSNPFTNTIDELLPNQPFPSSRIKVSSLDSSIPLICLKVSRG